MNDIHSQESAGWSSVGQLWGVVPAPVKGPRARFTVSDIARAGVALADRHGLAGVTLAAVAAELGLTTTALYRYVDAKDTLIEVMVDVAAGPPPEQAGSWRDRLRSWGTALLQVYLAHPWLAEVKPTRPPRCPNGIAWYDQALAALDTGRVCDPVNLVVHLNLLVRGYAALHQTLDQDGPVPDWFATVVAESFPGVAHQPAQVGDDLITGFKLAVDRVLASLPDESD